MLPSAAVEAGGADGKGDGPARGVVARAARTPDHPALVVGDEVRTYGELAALTSDLPAGALPMGYPMPMYQPPATTNSLARASLLLGIAEFCTMGLTAIPAIICGHLAKREMRLTTQRGDGMATAGLVLGYMAVAFWGILIALAIVGAVVSASSGGVGGP